MEQNKNLPEWTEDDIILFPSGIPGFENSKRFIIISVPEYEPFHWLQCIEGERIRFAIINPLVFKPDYNPKINRAEIGTLNISEPKDLLMYVIVTLRSPLSDSSVNLMGPLFVNFKTKTGKQIIIEDNAYSVREKLIN
ncbi:MAG: flagellar assembly protein FliW [Fibrobacteria bacterium]|nr:flagellar assembly protein FliW [Fibrobacteria bacterium]